MSQQPSHSTESLPPPDDQEEEAIHWGKVVGVGVAALLVFTGATYVSHRYQQTREKELQPHGPAPLPPQIGQAEIGIVDQVPFDVSRALANYKQDRMRRLESWGWSDRKRGLVHMPIERAMERIVAEQGKAEEKK